jgi:hypothetical protein
MPREVRFKGSYFARTALPSARVVLQPLLLHHPANGEPLGSARKVVRGLVKMQIGGIRG